jgi:hypothetical protein
MALSRRPRISLFAELIIRLGDAGKVDGGGAFLRVGNVNRLGVTLLGKQKLQGGGCVALFGHQIDGLFGTIIQQERLINRPAIFGIDGREFGDSVECGGGGLSLTGQSLIGSAEGQFFDVVVLLTILGVAGGEGFPVGLLEKNSLQQAPWSRRPGRAGQMLLRG